MKKKLLSILLFATMCSLCTIAQASVECLSNASVTSKSASDCVASGGAYIPDMLLEKSISRDLKAAALEHSAAAQYRVAGFVLRNSNRHQDRQLAITWYELSASQNYTPALLALAYLYRHGAPVVKPDVVKAVHYYHRATGNVEQNAEYVSAATSLYEESANLAEFYKLAGQLDGSQRALDKAVARTQFWRQELKSIDEGLEPMEFIEDRLIIHREDLDALRENYRTESKKLTRTVDEITILSAALEQGGSPEQVESVLNLVAKDLRHRQLDLSAELSQIALQQRRYDQARNNASYTPTDDSERLAFKSAQGNKAAFDEYLRDQEEKIQREKAVADRRKKKLDFLEKRISKLKTENKRSLSPDETVVMQRALTEISHRYQGKLNHLSASVEKEAENVANLTKELSSVEALSKEKDKYIAAVKGELTVSSSLVKQQTLLVKEQSKNLQEAINEMKAAHPQSELPMTSNQTKTTVGQGNAPKIAVKWPQFTENNGLKVAEVEADSKVNLVGAVYSQSRITNFSINQHTQELDANGLFLETIDVKRKPISVDLLMVNEFGEVVEEQFLLKPTLRANKKPAFTRHAKDIDFGDYYAIVIGNDQYKAEHFQPLDTAVYDAQSVAKVLESKYGFNVRLLLNASRDQTLKAFEEMRSVLTDKDNLLIYYAGHGVVDPESDQGYWLPTDATSDSTSRWISNATITDHVRALSSKNIMLIADSCYSGSLMRGTTLDYRSGLTAEKLAQRLQNDILLTTRVVLSSGGLQPVLDSIGNSKNSVFTSAMLKVLTENQAVLDANSLATTVSHDVVLATKDNVRQVPRFAPLLRAGHEGGEFYFVSLDWRDK